MQIVASQLQMSAAHGYRQRTELSERLSVSAGVPPPAPAAPSPRAADAPEAGAAAEADAAVSAPELAPLIRLVEWLTGERVRVFSLQPVEGAPAPSAAPAPAPAPAGGDAGSRLALRYEASRRYEEVEASVFSARGSIVTADGEQIEFTLQLTMARSYREESRLVVERAPVQRKDPLVINLDVPAARLVDARFRFDLDADGRDESLAGLAAGSGFLALDRNRNGRIDDGRELFGALSGDGFADLAALDADGNGWIDAGDAAFAELRVWRAVEDAAGVGLGLADAGVAAIATARVDTPFALRGAANSDLGALRATGVYLAADRAVGSVQQLDFSV